MRFVTRPFSARSPRTTARTAVLALASLLALGQTPGSAAERSAATIQKERALIQVLKSDAPAVEKAITCKNLAIYGSADAVPALAPLLADEQLSSWARIALEAIPGPAADDALRQALGKTQGRLLIGVINSIGARRDAEAVDGLAEKLAQQNVEVASAAAYALGRIGGDPAARVLEKSLATAPAAVRPAVAEGCVLCAEHYRVTGKTAEATRIFDAVRKASVPKQRILEATRGAILARQSAGLPLLLEQLRSTDPELFGIGLRTARELPGGDVTKALAAELSKCPAERQAPLLLALADRRDPAVLPAVRDLARTGPAKLRTVAVGVLDRQDDVASLPLFLQSAIDNDAGLAQAAKIALGRLEGESVNPDLLARLPQATGKTRQVLIELAGRRQLSEALPAIVHSTGDPDPGIRRAAVEAVGALGTEAQLADLVPLLQKASDAKDRGDLEKALRAICSRSGKRCVPNILPLTKSQEPTHRVTGLQLMAAVGGADALAAVKAAINDPVESVQDEAVRALSAWPSNWPDDEGVAEPLLALAKSGRKNAHQIQGVRGYLAAIQEDEKLAPATKVARVRELVAFMKRPEEKRLAIALLGTLPTADTLNLLTSFAAEPETTEEACLAIVTLVGRDPAKVGTKEARAQALQTVVDKSKTAKTRDKAEELLKDTK